MEGNGWGGYTHLDFLTALRAAPHDLALWSAYADWCREAGQDIKAERVGRMVANCRLRGMAPNAYTVEVYLPRVLTDAPYARAGEVACAGCGREADEIGLEHHMVPGTDRYCGCGSVLLTT